jgi:hypothetical protein
MIPSLLWLSPSDCDPPHRVTHPEKRDALTVALRAPWEPSCPVLLGYPLDGRVQLISGSHRHAAAVVAECLLPVYLYPYETIAELWGTDDWVALLAAPPCLQDVTG